MPPSLGATRCPVLRQAMRLPYAMSGTETRYAVPADGGDTLNFSEYLEKSCAHPQPTFSFKPPFSNSLF
eukprot:3116012-Rhodomonas_salina.1